MLMFIDMQWAEKTFLPTVMAYAFAFGGGGQFVAGVLGELISSPSRPCPAHVRSRACSVERRRRATAPTALQAVF